MPAAFRSNARGNDGIASGTTSVSVTVPASAEAGDRALVVVANNSGSTLISSAPSGWALEAGPIDDTNGNSWLYSKTIASGEPGTSVTWTFAASTRPVAEMIVFSGVTDTGQQLATPNTDSSSVSTLTVPTLPSVPAGAAVAVLFARDRTATSGTPADVTVTSPYSQGTPFERAATSFSGGSNVSTEVAYQIAGAAGSYGGESLSIAGGTSRGTTFLVALPAVDAAVAGTGALTAPSATLSGSGSVGSVITGTGAVAAPSATLSASATLTVSGDGALGAGSPTLSGSGSVFIAGDGELTAPAATLSGSGRFVRTVFRTPTLDVPFVMEGHLIGTLPYAKSVWRVGGVWADGFAPDAATVDAADRFFHGGYVHEVDPDQAAELTAAGYGAYIVTLELTV